MHRYVRDGSTWIAAAGETPVQRRGERWRHRPGSGKPGKVWKRRKTLHCLSLASQRKLLMGTEEMAKMVGHTLLGLKQTLSLRSDQELGSPSDPGLEPHPWVQLQTEYKRHLLTMQFILPALGTEQTWEEPQRIPNLQFDCPPLPQF